MANRPHKKQREVLEHLERIYIVHNYMGEDPQLPYKIALVAAMREYERNVPPEQQKSLEAFQEYARLSYLRTIINNTTQPGELRDISGRITLIMG